MRYLSLDALSAEKNVVKEAVIERCENNEDYNIRTPHPGATLLLVVADFSRTLLRSTCLHARTFSMNER